jgi:hypothetical protein
MTSNPDWDEDPADWDEFCECGHDLSDQSSHYHCANCGEEGGMMGHIAPPTWDFTCQRVVGWWNA